MQVTQYDNIDFRKLKRLTGINSSRSVVYKSMSQRKTIYKFFKSISKEKSYNKDKKIEIFSEIDFEPILKAESKIKHNDQLLGHITDYIKNKSIHSLRHLYNLEKMLKILVDVSRKLYEFHNLDGKPVFGDLNFGNIWITEDNRCIFGDFDSYGIYELKADDFPYALYSYCDFMNYDMPYDQYADKLSFMLATFDMIFGRNVLSIGEYTFDEKCEYYEYLKGLKELYLDLKCSHSQLPDVPYLYELIPR